MKRGLVTMLHRRMIAVLLVFMLLVCTGCSEKDSASTKDNVVYITTAAKTTAASTTAKTATTTRATTAATTKATTTTTKATTAAQATTTTQAAADEQDSETVERARALLTEVYESRVFSESLNMKENPGLLNQRDFTGPFLRASVVDDGRPYIPDVNKSADMDPALPEGVGFLPAELDELPEELLTLLMTPEKDDLLAEGKGMFALLEYTGYKKLGTYGKSFELFCHRSRVSFYDLETGEMLGWTDSTEYRSAPYILSSNMYANDGQRDVLKYENTIWNESLYWENGLNELFYDKNGYQVVGTRLVSVPEDADPVVVPDGVTWIEDSVGYRHKAVELILPDGLEYIGNSAFDFSALKSVNIPESVRYVGDLALDNTPWMREIEESEGYLIVGDGVLLYANTEGDEITLPPDVRYVMPGALDDLRCKKLIVPETVIQLCGVKDNVSAYAMNHNNYLETLVLYGGLKRALDFPGTDLYVLNACNELKTIVIDCEMEERPYMELYIVPDFFHNITIYCDEDSPAEAWAKKEGFRVLSLSEYKDD